LVIGKRKRHRKSGAVILCKIHCHFIAIFAFSEYQERHIGGKTGLIFNAEKQTVYLKNGELKKYPGILNKYRDVLVAE